MLLNIELPGNLSGTQVSECTEAKSTRNGWGKKRCQKKTTAVDLIEKTEVMQLCAQLPAIPNVLEYTASVIFIHPVRSFNMVVQGGTDASVSSVWVQQWNRGVDINALLMCFWMCSGGRRSGVRIRASRHSDSFVATQLIFHDASLPYVSTRLMRRWAPPLLSFFGELPKKDGGILAKMFLLIWSGTTAGIFATISSRVRNNTAAVPELNDNVQPFFFLLHIMY